MNKGLGSRLAKNLKQKNTLFFIAEEKGKIVGFCGVEIKKNPGCIKHKRRGHMFTLYVTPNFRKRGIGVRLAKKTLAWLKKNNVSDQVIYVYAHNKFAYNIYKRIGFKDYMHELVK